MKFCKNVQYMLLAIINTANFTFNATDYKAYLHKALHNVVKTNCIKLRILRMNII